MPLENSIFCIKYKIRKFSCCPQPAKAWQYYKLSFIEQSINVQLKKSFRSSNYLAIYLLFLEYEWLIIKYKFPLNISYQQQLKQTEDIKNTFIDSKTIGVSPRWKHQARLAFEVNEKLQDYIKQLQCTLIKYPKFHCIEWITKRRIEIESLTFDIIAIFVIEW